MRHHQESIAQDELPVPTAEQLELALQRVATDEMGRQTLDGYYFPPDNEEPFHPCILRMHHLNTGKTTEYQSRFPNSSARRTNLELAALGRGPLFIRDDDPEHLRKMQEWADRDRSYRSPIQRLVYRALGWD